MLAVWSSVPSNTTEGEYEMFGIAYRKVASTCGRFVWWGKKALERFEDDRLRSITEG